MKRLLVPFAALTALGTLAACQTAAQPVTYGCRAPSTEEFEIFRAIISRDRHTLTRMSAPGPARDALVRQDPYANGHLWGNQGYTGRTLVGVLTQPPPCVIDEPPARNADGDIITTQRTILVYQEDRFRSMTGGSFTIEGGMPFRAPGVSRQDYFRCRFVQTSAGWRMADLCSLPTVGGAVGE